MRCEGCNSLFQKLDRRNEVADLDESATDGQMADFMAAELSGENGAWNLGIVDYCCHTCKANFTLQRDELQRFDDLILAWHNKAKKGDFFSRFVFEYLAFIAHIRNNIFYSFRSDRQVIEALKKDLRIKETYLDLTRCDEGLNEAWIRIIDELDKRPILNSSYDFDHPEVDGNWNSNANGSSTLARGVIHSNEDWENMVEYWYCVRNNLFHGGKNPNIERDLFLVKYAFFTLRPLVESEIALLVK